MHLRVVGRLLVAVSLAVVASAICMGGTVAQENPADTASLAQTLGDLMPRVASYEYGGDAEALETVAALVVKSHAYPAERRELAGRLAALLETDATLPAKQFACRQLYLIGDDDAVPVLGRLLLNDETVDMARYALERMPGAPASKALREALNNVSGRAKVGIVNSLGERRDSRDAGVMARLMRDPDEGVARAALAALGKIGGPEAVAALSRAKIRMSPTILPVVDEALLLCADRWRAEGETARAGVLYEALHQPSELPQTRAAALKGLVEVRGADSLPLVVAALEGVDPIVRGAASDVLYSASDDRLADAVTDAFPRLGPKALIPAVHALARRGAPSLLPVLTALARTHAEPAVRAAALEGIVTLGQWDESALIALACAAATGSEDEARAGRLGLDRLSAPEIDDVLMGWLADPFSLAFAVADTGRVEAVDSDKHRITVPVDAVRVELARSLAARGARQSVSTLMDVAADRSAALRTEAFRSLAVLASAQELPGLVALLVAEQEEGPRAEAESAVVRIARDAEDPASPVLGAYPATGGDPAARCALIRVLGRIGDDRALDVLRQALKERDAAVQEAAIRSLAQWPTPAPLDDLHRIAKRGPSKALETVALRAYIRLLALPSDRSASKTLRRYKKALRLVSGADEKRMAIAGLAELPHPGTIRLLERYEKDEELADDVALALQKARSRSYGVSASHNSDEAGLAVDGEPGTRWATGTAQKPGQWFMVDFGDERRVRKIVLDAGPSTGDYPRGYEVYVSNRSESWGEPVATGKGAGAVVEIRFESKKGRFVRIVQTGSDGLWWSIYELSIDTD